MARSNIENLRLARRADLGSALIALFVASAAGLLCPRALAGKADAVVASEDLARLQDAALRGDWERATAVALARLWADAFRDRVTPGQEGSGTDDRLLTHFAKSQVGKPPWMWIVDLDKFPFEGLATELQRGPLAPLTELERKLSTELANAAVERFFQIARSGTAVTAHSLLEQPAPVASRQAVQQSDNSHGRLNSGLGETASARSRRGAGENSVAGDVLHRSEVPTRFWLYHLSAWALGEGLKAAALRQKGSIFSAPATALTQGVAGLPRLLRWVDRHAERANRSQPAIPWMPPRRGVVH